MAITRSTSSLRIRYAFAVLLLACFSVVQTRAAITETVHNHGSSHTDCCAVCHAGHHSVVQARNIISIAPPGVAGWHTPADLAPLTGECLAILRCSRAPPA